MKVSVKRKSIAVVLTMIITVSGILAGCSSSADTTTVPTASEEVRVSDSNGSDTEKEKEAEVVPGAKETVSPESDETSDEVADDTVENIDYLSVYAPIIDRFIDGVYYLKTDDDVYHEMEFGGFIGLMDVCYSSDIDQILSNLGYIIEDFSGDGIDDLVIVDAYDSKEQKYESILGFYTLKDEKPYFVFEGSARNSYEFMDNGHFYNLGSGGAAYSCCGEAYVSLDGRELLWKDFYFTNETDDTYENYGVFWNDTGIWEADESELLGDADDFDKYWKQYDNVTVFKKPAQNLLDYSKSEYYHNNNTTSEIDISLMSADLYSGNINNLESLIFSDGEFKTEIVFTAENNVKDLEFYGLTLEHFTDDGIARFSKMNLDGVDELKKGESVAVTIEFIGDIPNYGLSYKDESGNVRYFSIDESGKDGSLYLTELL